MITPEELYNLLDDNWNTFKNIKKHVKEKLNYDLSMCEFLPLKNELMNKGLMSYQYFYLINNMDLKKTRVYKKFKQKG